KTVTMTIRHATRHFDRNDIGILLCKFVNGDLLLVRYFTTGRKLWKLSLVTGVLPFSPHEGLERGRSDYDTDQKSLCDEDGASAIRTSS
ncbi:MAG: hypothetical protein WBX22_05155, partial [Silvibacterium sp.]